MPQFSIKEPISIVDGTGKEYSSTVAKCLFHAIELLTKEKESEIFFFCSSKGNRISEQIIILPKGSSNEKLNPILKACENSRDNLIAIGTIDNSTIVKIKELSHSYVGQHLCIRSLQSLMDLGNTALLFIVGDSVEQFSGVVTLPDECTEEAVLAKYNIPPHHMVGYGSVTEHCLTYNDMSVADAA